MTSISNLSVGNACRASPCTVRGMFADSFRTGTMTLMSMAESHFEGRAERRRPQRLDSTRRLTPLGPPVSLSCAIQANNFQSGAHERHHVEPDRQPADVEAVELHLVADIRHRHVRRQV